MKIIVYFSFSLIIFISCCNENKFEKQLNAIDSIMQKDPDSAYSALKRLNSEAIKQKSRLYLRYEMTIADAQNKLRIPLTKDSIMKQVVEYYDRSGNNYMKLKSTYLLGCVYRDKGDAPYALRCYHEALTYADTIGKDCNYRLMAIIYGQMSDIYRDCGLYSLAIESTNKAVSYMYTAKDTLSALIMKEDLLNAYNMMGKDIVSARKAEDLVEEYRRHNLESESSYSLLAAIHSNLKLGNHQKALYHINKLEALTNRHFQDKMPFDIAYYYCYKGCYFQKAESLDSAIYYCNKALDTSDNIDIAIDSYNCLMTAYKKKKDFAKAVEYANLYCTANDSSMVRKSQNVINRLHAEYNYNRAEKEKNIAVRRTYILKFCLIVALFFTFLSITVIWRYYAKKKAQQLMLILDSNKKHANLINAYDKALEDYKLLRSDFEAYKTKKENEIQYAGDKLIANSGQDTDSKSLYITNMINGGKVLNDIRSRIADNVVPTNKELRELNKIVERHYPIFWQFISCPQHNLTEQEKLACVLIRLYFIPSEIAFMMSVSLQRVTNIKSKINQKLFNGKGAKDIAARLTALN